MQEPFGAGHGGDLLKGVISSVRFDPHYREKREVSHRLQIEQASQVHRDGDANRFSPSHLLLFELKLLKGVDEYGAKVLADRQIMELPAPLRSELFILALMTFTRSSYEPDPL